MKGRLAALEANFGYLQGELDDRTRELDRRFDEVERRQRQMRADIDRQHQEREAERKEFMRESIKLQVWATGVFVLGVFLSVLGNAVTC